MSLILDALKRSRGDASSVPGVDTYHLSEPLERPGHSRLPWIALGIACALIVWLLLERGADDEVVVQPAVATVEPALPAKTPVTAAPQTPVAVASPAPASLDDTPVAVPQPAPEPAPAVARPPAAVAVGPADDSAEQDDAVQALYEERSRALAAARQEVSAADSTRESPAATTATPAPKSKPEVQEQPVDLEQMLQQARNDMETAELAEHAAPFIGRMSQQSRNDIPTILYQRHDYSGQAGRATVVMNGKTLRVGGSPVAGVKIDEILPNSTVLSYRGTQFRLRALNSWVNL